MLEMEFAPEVEELVEETKKDNVDKIKVLNK